MLSPQRHRVLSKMLRRIFGAPQRICEYMSADSQVKPALALLGLLCIHCTSIALNSSFAILTPSRSLMSALKFIFPLSLALFVACASTPNETPVETPNQKVEADQKMPTNELAPATVPKPMGGAATLTGDTPAESKLDDAGKLDINAVIKSRREALTTCYDKDLEGLTLPADGFLVKAAFTIEADGHVSGAKILEATQQFKGAEDCFLLELATIIFPAPPEGRVVEASYPFKIKRK